MVYILVLLMVLLTHPVLANDPDVELARSQSRKALENLSEIGKVIVEKIGEPLREHGLTEEYVLTLAELELRRAGCRIAGTLALGRPVMTIVAWGLRNRSPNGMSSPVWGVEVTLREPVKVVRTGTEISATVWDQSGVGTGGENVRDGVKSTLVNVLGIFVNDWLGGCPKKSQFISR